MKQRRTKTDFRLDMIRNLTNSDLAVNLKLIDDEELFS